MSRQGREASDTVQRNGGYPKAVPLPSMGTFGRKRSEDKIEGLYSQN